MALLALALATAAPAAQAQAITGTTSLLTAPTAVMPGDGVARIGAGVLHRDRQAYGEGAYHVATYHAAIAFLPALEVGFRFSLLLSDEPQALGDRAVSARLRVLPERRRRPALVLGAHDFLFDRNRGNTHYNSLYAVASKHVANPLGAPPVGLHLGYGSDRIEAAHHAFVGLFGGLSVPLAPWFTLLAEYDGATANGGVRVRPTGFLQLDVGIEGLSAPVAGLALEWEL